VVEGDAVLQLQRPVDHLEAVVGDGVAVRIAGVGILRGEAADRRAGRVLVESRAVEADGDGPLVDVGDREGEALRGAEPAGIHRGHGHVDGGFRLVIEGDAVLQLQRAIDDFEAVV